MALIAANVMHATLSAPSVTLLGNPGELLYVSSFSGFDADWELYESQQSARIIEEKLEIEVGASQTAAWSTARPRFADFDLRVEASARAGPVDNAFGVVFHVSDGEPSECTLPAVILCGIEDLAPLAGAAFRQTLDTAQDSQSYSFLISSDGYYSLWHNEDGAARALSAWIATPVINQDLRAMNSIRVVASGSSYRFFINGQSVPLCIPDDAAAASTYAGGQCIDGSMRQSYEAAEQSFGTLGLIAQSTATGGGGVVVQFDNVIIYSPAHHSAEDAKL